MRRYPEYKESGVEWIGAIPKDWEIGKINHIATFVSQKSTPETDAIKISPENVESETGKVLDFYSSYDSGGVKFQSGDVLFNKLRVYLSKVVFAEYSGYSLGEMIVIRPSLQDTGKYLFYLMLSCRFIEYCNSISEGVKMPRTAVDDILNAQIPIPTTQEQTQITNFLDRKTKQIDELIRLKEQRIELLQEQRAALINQVVTKGLNPNVEMKPSRVEWIGEIPVHWEIGKIKHIATFVSEKSTPEIGAIKISPENVESETGRVLDFYSSYDSVGVKFQAGDVLFNKLRVYLSKVVFAKYGGYSLGEMIVIRPSLQRMGKYLFLLDAIQSTSLNQLQCYILRGEDATNSLDEFWMPNSHDFNQEQAQIANFLDCKTKQIDKLITTEQRKIELLKEYRQSLISEVVTGKIDVRSEV